MLKHKAFFDKTTKNITALIFGLINVNEIIFYTTKAQKIFLLNKFSCVKNQITPAFLTSINVNEITSQDEVDTTGWIRTHTSTV